MAVDLLGPSMTQRREKILFPQELVVKLGTQVLSDAQQTLDAGFIRQIAAQIAGLRAAGARVTIVSSGAIGAGLRELRLAKRPGDLATLQAVAAVGQRRLMDVWSDAFEPFDIPVAQLLLTREDIDQRARFLNVRNTITAAHALGAIPIINENDTISTDELIKITFGDNDILAALVATALRADLLILLTVVDGLLDRAGKRLSVVSDLAGVEALIRPEKSALGKGGMNSKLEAARRLLECGEALMVANGRTENILPRLLAGEDLGTLFTSGAAGAAPRKRTGRNRWIGAARPAGTITIDEGAARALRDNNKSLLAAGVVRVDGKFERGDVVAIVGAGGESIARGLTNYNAGDLTVIAGKRSADVRALMKDRSYDEIVHRDHLVLDERKASTSLP